jgi:O-antigen ligase
MEMLRWFVPVFSTFLIAKHAFPLLVPKILYWILLNSGINALLAITHEFAGWRYMFEFWGYVQNPRDAGPDTFGSFGYPNHAATYFILLFAFGAGLFLREVLQDRSQIRPFRALATGAGSLLFFFTAQFSASRAGILGSWMVLIFILLTVVTFSWPRIHPVQKLYGFLCAIFLLSILIAGFRMLANPVHLREFAKATTELNAAREVHARWFQVLSAWDIWKDNPWFGVGGWGYRYLVSFYLDPAMWGVLGRGKANVHNDFFQFLCEFGLVGMSFLFAVFLPPVFRIVRDIRHPAHDDRSVWADPVRFCLCYGLLLMIAHSMIDLPFRSPAVFAHGALFLLMAQQKHGFRTVWSEPVDWHALQPPVRLRGIRS